MSEKKGHDDKNYLNSNFTNDDEIYLNPVDIQFKFEKDEKEKRIKMKFNKSLSWFKNYYRGRVNNDEKALEELSMFIKEIKAILYDEGILKK